MWSEGVLWMHSDMGSATGQGTIFLSRNIEHTEIIPYQKKNVEV